MEFFNKICKKGHYPVLHTTNFIINFEQILEILEIFSQKMTLPNESRTNEYLHRIFRIRISLGTKFQFKPTSLIFWTKFAQKEYFRSTTEKVNITSEFCMFELVLLPNVNLNYFKFWYQICPKRVFLVEKEKCEH